MIFIIGWHLYIWLVKYFDILQQYFTLVFDRLDEASATVCMAIIYMYVIPHNVGVYILYLLQERSERIITIRNPLHY